MNLSSGLGWAVAPTGNAPENLTAGALTPKHVLQEDETFKIVVECRSKPVWHALAYLNASGEG
jgi:hypothetical protein